MTQGKNAKDQPVIRLGLIIGAAIIIGGVLTPNLSSYLLAPKPLTRLQTPTMREKWQFTAGGAITGALALGEDGSVYFASEDGSVYAVDSSGNLQWKFNTGPILAGPTIGADGTIYVTDSDQRALAINRTGTQQWAIEAGRQAAVPAGVSSAVDQDHLYTLWQGQVHALRLDGSLPPDWTAGVGMQTNGSVAILPNGSIVYPGAGRLEEADSTGRTVWEYPVMDPPLSVDMLLRNGGQPPLGNFWLDSGIAVGPDGALYVCGVDQPGNERRANSRLVALAPDGTLKWEFHTGALSFNRATPVIATDGTLYFGSGNGMLYALSSDGLKRWAVSTGSEIVATMLAEDGTVYVLNRGDLIAISPEGKLLSQTPISEILEKPRVQVIAYSIEQRKVLTKLPFDTSVATSPTLAADGTIYVGTHAGKIMAFAGTHGGLMNSPWPKFQANVANSGRANVNSEWH